jgi:hypothetical protein
MMRGRRSMLHRGLPGQARASVTVWACETKAIAMRGRLFTEVCGTSGDVRIKDSRRGAGFAAG